MDNGTEELV